MSQPEHSRTPNRSIEELLDEDSHVSKMLGDELSEVLEEYVDTAQNNSVVIADLSRDIRDGLATVVGYSDILLDEVKADHNAELVRIRDSARDLLSAVQKLEDIVATERDYRRIAETLHSIITIGTETDDIYEFATDVFENIEAIIDFDAAQLWLEGANGALELTAHRANAPLEQLEPIDDIQIQNPQSHPLTRNGYDTPSPYRVNGDSVLDFYHPPVVQWLCIPIFDAETDQRLGMLSFGTRTSGFDSTGVRVATRIARHISTIVVQTKQMGQIRHQATTDPLTGIANRRHFFEAAQSRIEQSYRSASPLSLLLLDIDYFKDLNDDHGHLAGDKVLEAVASTLEDNLRAPDLLGRYGGEEFAIMLPDTPIDPHGRDVAQRIRRAIEELSVDTEDAADLSCTISIGISGIRVDGEKTHDLISLIKAADEALYRAKDNGRNCVEVGD